MKKRVAPSTTRPRQRSAERLRLLVTGFGPFPGAPVNPTGPLVRSVAALLRARGADIEIATHVFATTYAAVESDLPRLLAQHRPHAIVMFGLATKSRGLRIEIQARNRICRKPDAAGIVPVAHKIRAAPTPALPIRAPRTALLKAAQSGAWPARLSGNAGDYLCNYLYWHALEAVRRGGMPSRAAFIHVPLLDPDAAKSGRGPDELALSAAAVTRALLRSLRRTRH
jgi:pyroglutamyl-peptidase